MSTSVVPPRRVLANHNEEYERSGVLLNCPSTPISLTSQGFNPYHTLWMGFQKRMLGSGVARGRRIAHDLSAGIDSIGKAIGPAESAEVGNGCRQSRTDQRSETTSTYSAPPAPEPATVAMLGGALIGLGLLGKRLKRS